jgi:hypothetical protein
MTEVDLEAVEPGPHRETGRGGVLLGDPHEVGLGGGPDHLEAERAGQAVRRQRVDAVRASVGHRAGVPDLRGDRGTGLMNRVGQPAQAGQRLLTQVDLVPVRATLRSDREVGHGGFPTPPRATRRWKSIRSSVTSPSGVIPSNVAALMTRLRSATGPSLAGAKTSGLSTSKM